MQQLLALRRRLSLLTFRDWFIIALIVVAGFLRFWKLDESALFLGDQGRDALIVSRIFREGDLVSIGPTTSVGNMYLGPLYYYFMAPFLWLSYPSPLGPAFAVAALGTMSVFFLYYWGRKLVGAQAALWAASLSAVSAVAISLSRFSWNPNPAPFVTLAMVYATHLAVTKSPKFWLLVGFCFAILLQLHYITLLAGGAAGLIWLFQIYQAFRAKEKKMIKPLMGYALGAAAIVVASLAPLVFFDAKHDWLNFQSLQSLVSNSENFEQAQSASSSFVEILKETHGRAMHILFEFLIGKEQLWNRILNTVLVLAMVVYLALYFVKVRDKKYQAGVAILTVYMVVGILGLSTYKHTVFDHYIAYLFPITFLLLGFMLAKLSTAGIVGKALAATFFAFVLFTNIPRYSFKPSGTGFAALSQTAVSIYNRVAPDQKYGIALLSGTKDYHGMNYRYYLSLNKEKQPLDVSLQNSAEIIFIIDEEKKYAQPQYVDIFEISSFPGKRVVDRYDIPDGPTVTVLKRDLIEAVPKKK